jgi:type I restriction enzyme, S subunit
MEKDLPKGWSFESIQNSLEFVIGGDWGIDPDKDSEIETEKVYCIRGSEIKNWDIDKGKTSVLRKIKSSSLEKRNLLEGDILLEISGGGPDQPVGRTVVIDQVALTLFDCPIICTNFLRLLRFKKINNSFYINYFLKSFYLSGEIVKYQGGSNNLRNLKYKDFETINIPLPPLPEQERIVAKLDSVFAHLEVAKQGLEKIPVLLKDFRQAVLTQAVTGKLTEEWREGKELEGVDCLLLEENRISEIENENFQLEKLGKRKQKETPFTVFGKNELGWLIVNVESACVFIVDCLHNTPQFESTGYSVIDTTCISPFKIDWDKARKVNSEYFEKWTERLTPNYGDILFSREGTIGIAVKVPEGAELCIGQRMMLFRMAKFVLPEYAEIYFNSFIFRDEYFPHIKGVAAQHLNIGSIRELPFPIPSFLEQTEIVRRVEALFSKADAIEAQYKIVKEQIDQLPQAVLAKAFRGEI